MSAPFSPDSITGRQKRTLRGLAHSFEPIVRVGNGGVTDGVLGAVKRALLDHELIKVRLHEPEDKKVMAAALATGTQATLCGMVGHTVTLYRPHPKTPVIRLK